MAFLADAKRGFHPDEDMLSSFSQLCVKCWP